MFDHFDAPKPDLQSKSPVKQLNNDWDTLLRNKTFHYFQDEALSTNINKQTYIASEYTADTSVHSPQKSWNVFPWINKSKYYYKKQSSYTTIHAVTVNPWKAAADQMNLLTQEKG